MHRFSHLKLYFIHVIFHENTASTKVYIFMVIKFILKQQHYSLILGIIKEVGLENTTTNQRCIFVPT